MPENKKIPAFFDKGHMRLCSHGLILIRFTFLERSASCPTEQRRLCPLGRSCWRSEEKKEEKEKMTMRDLTELNINEGGKPVDRQPPSDAVIAAFEAEIGMPLPAELIHFLRFSNGGHPELDAVDGADGEFAVNHFYHLTEEDRGTESLWHAAEEWRPIVGTDYIPFAETGGGDPFMLDVSETPPSVNICLHNENMDIYEVSPSFEAFIDSLAINPNYH